MFADYSTEAEALTLREEATADRAADIAATTEQLGEEKKAVESKLDEAKDLLADLEAEERERLLSTTSRSAATRMPASAPASGRAAAAVSYAMAQVGDAYVYGATGDSAFDCSGLTMRAWGAAGVGLPHSSSAQYSSGPHISASALQPGDLVFYYSPISHVGMYIGNGMIVHAANPSTGVAGRRSLLDAVRRRGPPWLIARPRGPVAHAGGWPVFRCSRGWWSLVALLARLRDDTHRVARRPLAGRGRTARRAPRPRRCTGSSRR